MKRLRVVFEGRVQGVGFRPFVWRKANECSVTGWVRNERGCVVCELQGEEPSLQAMLEAMQVPPPAAVIERCAVSDVPLVQEHSFEILQSEQGAGVFAIPADLAPCAACAREVQEPAERRYEYPFTNCTECGPRYSIAKALPWDRASTSMAEFALCEACAREFHSIADRRFHAQPIACPKCGPSVRLLDRTGALLARERVALERAVQVLREGCILALLGVGGFQLLCRANDEAAVQRLRERKRRKKKPFAVLVQDLEEVRSLCVCDADAERVLSSPSAPIVLLPKRRALAASVAPGQDRYGVFLPASPLHQWLLRAMREPLVCTSGNVHEEPIVASVEEGVEELGSIADALLVHDRAVVHPIDDGVVHMVDGVARTLRLGRGLGPLQVRMEGEGVAMSAWGAQQKQAPAVWLQGHAVLGAHVGDLGTYRAQQAAEQSMEGLCALLQCKPERTVCDAHPDYSSTLLAEKSGLPLERVQHHHAHIAACFAEYGITNGLGFAWDGTGWGLDQTVWGGEALWVDGLSAKRVAHWKPFPLPGGDAAMRAPGRSLVGMFVGNDLEIPAWMRAKWGRFEALARSERVMRTSSVGRMFDAVAALVGVCEEPSFEAEAAMALEQLAARVPKQEPYPVHLRAGVLDLREALVQMEQERADAERVAARFHATLLEAVLLVVQEERASVVALTGGCFQNALLATMVMESLRARGVRVFLPSRVPVNDGGIALGQLWVALQRRRTE